MYDLLLMCLVKKSWEAGVYTVRLVDQYHTDVVTLSQLEHWFTLITDLWQHSVTQCAGGQRTQDWQTLEPASVCQHSGQWSHSEENNKNYL